MSTLNKKNNEKRDYEFPYIPPSMRCQPIIDFTSLNFHNSKFKTPINIFEDNTNIFGIFDIKIRGEIPIAKKHINLRFSVDSSGSMAETCIDGKSKMEHIKHTLENIIILFRDNKQCSVSVHIQSFDTEITVILDNIDNIHNANIDDLLYSINQLSPGKSTNIELALKTAKEDINKYNVKNPNHEIIHIFLTDGDITEGSNNFEQLELLIPNNCTNIFIGYGSEHNSELLCYLAKNKGNDYRFIDVIERAGLVYGEIINEILYKAIEDVKLTVLNGEIYNFLTNSWTETLEIGNLLNEQKKTFHIRCKNPIVCCVSMMGKTIIKTRQFQTINIYEVQTETYKLLEFPDPDLNIYIFRQRTQELLYETKKILVKQEKIEYMLNNLAFEANKKFEKIKKIKEELNMFHKIMLDYIQEFGLECNEIMKMLCDDIYIAYKTIDTRLGSMYIHSRQISNGRQHTYMCSSPSEKIISYSTDSLHIRIPQLNRQINNNNIVLTEEIIFDNTTTQIDNYIPSQDFLSPYSTEGTIRLMRDISGNKSIGLNLP